MSPGRGEGANTALRDAKLLRHLLIDRAVSRSPPKVSFTPPQVGCYTACRDRDMRTVGGGHTPMKAVYKKEAALRLKVAAGHLESVRRMVDDDAYCVDLM